MGLDPRHEDDAGADPLVFENRVQLAGFALLERSEELVELFVSRPPLDVDIDGADIFGARHADGSGGEVRGEFSPLCWAEMARRGRPGAGAGDRQARHCANKCRSDVVHGVVTFLFPKSFNSSFALRAGRARNRARPHSFDSCQPRRQAAHTDHVIARPRSRQRRWSRFRPHHERARTTPDCR